MSSRSLTWSTAHKYGSDSLAHSFPNFQFNAKDAANVKVEARSPSGRMSDLTVDETSGVFTCNFTPTEVGDWLISIMYDGRHIQGSPFNVRVYDAARVRVFGLEGGAVGKNFNFQVDTAGAGEGTLAVDITRNGRSLPCNVTNEGRGMYRINFTPDGSGIYSIKVMFAGMEVPGSPYSFEIKDTTQVKASGEGLSSVEVNKRAAFNLNTGPGGNPNDIKVNVTSPRGQQVPANIVNNGNGNFSIEYTPVEVGEYLVDVNYYNKPISGSPFRVQAYDWNLISVNNIKSTGVVGRQIDFDIDASQAGSGNLEIMVNEGTIPCSVQNRGNRQFHASFVPKEPITHYIQMRFNGKQVQGSPWRVDIRGAASAAASGSGLQSVTVGQPASFDVRVSGGAPDGELLVTITPPSRRSAPAHVTSNFNGNYKVEYTPKEVGSHQIDVLYEGAPIAGSPFTSKATDLSAIKVSAIQSGVTGRPVEFQIDVTQAGEGQLEIMVNRGQVPNSVKLLRKGIFLVTFVPRDARPHTIDIKFNGNLIPQCPINVPIMDSSRVTVQGDGLRQVAVNRQSFFRVNTQAAGDADLSARVTSPSGRQVPCNVTGGGLAGFECDFTPFEVGNHRVDIDFANQPVPGSPFTVKVFDPSKVIIRGIRDGVVNQKSSFLVEVPDSAGEGNMEISITGNGRNIQNHVSQVAKGQFEVTFTPMESVPHTTNVTFNGIHVTGSPFTFNVMDASKVTASGEGLDLIPCKRPTTFTIHSPGGRLEDLTVKILSPSGRPVQAQASDLGTGDVAVDYTPLETGDFRVDVKYLDQAISGSPFNPRCFDPSAVVVSGIRPTSVGKAANFQIDATRAGAGNLEIIVSVRGDNVPNFVKGQGKGMFEVSFTPQVADTHMISVKFNGDSVPGSPFMCDMIDKPCLHYLEEDRLIRVPIGRPAVVSIDPRRAGAVADLAIVEVIGPHCIQASIQDVEIPGSPFACEVYDLSQVHVSRLRRGVVGKPYEFEIDASRAGKGDVEVIIKSGNRKVTCKVVAKGNQLYKVFFMPKEPIKHLLLVTFGLETVPGSPFVIDVEDTTMVKAIGKSLEATSVYNKAAFAIDPSRALFVANARVKITGPPPMKYNVPYYMEGNYMEGWHVEWQPTELGIYSVEIKYGDSHIMGSPFRCKVYDLSKVVLIRDESMKGVDMDGIPGEDVVFYVDASEAGAGNLEIIVRCAKDRTRIPNFLEAADRSGKFRIYFTPRPDCHRYHVEATFNEEHIIGSPFYCAVIDGSQATASGDGLRYVPAKRPASFDVSTNGIGEADLAVKILSPSGRPVQSRAIVQGSPPVGFRVEYVPMETGRHTINVTYADAEITGSPFYPEVYDITMVRVSPIKDGLSNIPVKFEVDASAAGTGNVVVAVQGPNTTPYCEVTPMGGQKFEAAFTPTEGGQHLVAVKFNEENVPRSPFRVNYYDASKMMITWEKIRLVPARRTATFEMDPRGIPNNELKLNILDPYNRQVPGRVARFENQFRIEFMPNDVGPHTVELRYGGTHVTGSPYTCNVYDASKVRIRDITQSGRMGAEAGFTVDSSEAGEGDLDVQVTVGGQRVNANYNQIDANQYRFTFMPAAPANHMADVTFNYEKVPGSPVTVPVIDGSRATASGEGLRFVPANQPAHFQVHTARVGVADLAVKVTSPDGEEIGRSVRGNSKSGYTVEFVPRNVGTHTVEVLYADMPINGSPFQVVAYDIGLLEIGAVPNGIVGEVLTFEVDCRRVGVVNASSFRAEIRGMRTRPDTQINALNEGVILVSFTPQESGLHSIQLMYDNKEISASPLSCSVVDPGRVTASGDGLKLVPARKGAHFILDATDAGSADSAALITSPSGDEVPNSVQAIGGARFRVEYVPTITGSHSVVLLYAGRQVKGSPFSPEVYDSSLVTVGELSDGTVGDLVYLEVDASKAGTGSVTAEVKGPRTRPRPKVTTLSNERYEVSFKTTEAGKHDVKVLFNNEEVPDSPLAADFKYGNISASWQQLSLIPVRRLAAFEMDAGKAPDAEVTVAVTDPFGKRISGRVVRTEQRYRIEFTPTSVGPHLIALAYGGQPVTGSPHTCNVYDPSAIQVKDVSQNGVIGNEMSFTVDSSRAGVGDLAVKVMCQGQTVQTRAEEIDINVVRFVFVPAVCAQHLAELSFNYEKVPGSPIAMSVIDASTVAASGRGLQLTPANQVAVFQVHTNNMAEADLNIKITSPRGVDVPGTVQGSPLGGYTVQYTPTECGRHDVKVEYANMEVRGSPFHPEVYDASLVTVGEIADGTVGQMSTFEVDTSRAGPGTVTVEVTGPRTRSQPRVVAEGNSTAEVTFKTIEGGVHKVKVFFNGMPVPGSPFSANFTYGNISANWEQLRLIPARRPAAFEMDPGGSPDAEVKVTVTDPYGSPVGGVVSKRDDRYRIDFTPSRVGSHVISVNYGGQAIQGSPYTCQVYDADKVRLSDVSQTGVIGEQMGFTVDSSEAGEGQLDVKVTSQGQTVSTHCTQLSDYRWRFTYVPTLPLDHLSVITFNYQKVPGSPLVQCPIDGSQVTASGDGLRLASANSIAVFQIHTSRIKPADLAVKIISPRGNDVPTVVQGSTQSGYTVQYTPTEVGRHNVQVEYANMEIRGSPFLPEIYDASLVTVGEITDGTVGQMSTFEVDTSRAGPGTVTVEVTGPRTKSQPRVVAEGNSTAEVTFKTIEGGVHKVKVFFNGMPVPGSPFSANFTYGNISANWEQLRLIPARRPAAFEMDPGGSPDAEVMVTVTDPYGSPVGGVVSKRDDRYRIDFTPSRVGSHPISVNYGGQAIQGSPYTCQVYDADKVRLSDVSQTGVIGEEMGFTVDTSEAGEGQLNVQVTSQGQSVSTHCTQLSDSRWRFTYVPTLPLDHLCDIAFNYQKVPGSPLVQCPIDGSQVTASGDGLRLASANSLAVFQVHTARIQPANLAVKIISPMGNDVPVVMQGSPQAGFTVQYTPTEAGRHNVQVQYANMEIRGSPFQPEVFDASLVTVGEIADGTVGDLSTFEVDSSRAGPGSVTVEVTGPRTKSQPKVVSDGNSTAEVTFKTIEGGKHMIKVFFNGIPVPGSPFSAFFTYRNIATSWEQLRQIPANRPAAFELDPHDSPEAEVIVTITDPKGESVPCGITKIEKRFRIEFIPTEVGPHKISVTYGGQAVTGSPYVCNVYDASRVRVYDVMPLGVIGEPLGFKVDSSEAGDGDLNVLVTCAGDVIQATCTELQGNHWSFVYTPSVLLDHQVEIAFNYQKVPGSPLVQSIMDGSRAYASGRGLEVVPASRPTFFEVQTADIGVAELAIKITSPLGSKVPSVIQGSAQAGFSVQYTPTEAGRHNVQVYYANMEIHGSPFYPDVYDASLVTVEEIADGIVGEMTTFIVDSSRAGPGSVTVEIAGPHTKSQPRVVSDGVSGAEVTFRTIEAGIHKVKVFFNGEVVPGSPFSAKFVYSDIAASWESLDLVPVNRIAAFDVDPHGAPDAEVVVLIKDPRGRPLNGMVTKEDDHHHCEFKPLIIGPHIISVQYGGQSVPGSPHTCQVYDAAKVRITDISQNGILGREMSFTVDSSDAGMGDVDARVACGGQNVVATMTSLREGVQRYTFIPRVPMDQIGNVTFNFETVPGSPFPMSVVNGSLATAKGEGLRRCAANKRASFKVKTSHVGPADLAVTITSPVGNDLDATIRGNPRTGFDVQYTPEEVGEHVIQVEYANMEIRGSPFYPDVFDANLVTVSEIPDGLVGDLVEFEVDSSMAGPGTVTVEIAGPRSRPQARTVASGNSKTDVTFKTTEGGVHKVKVMFNGQVVPDCPLTPKFTYGNISANWEHLRLIPVRKLAAFEMDPHEAPDAEVLVKVQDPSGGVMSGQVQQRQEGTGGYEMEFTPLLVGPHQISVMYGGQKIPGSPFTCNVYDASKVRVLDVTPNAAIETEMGFTVDSSEAGNGEIGIQVSAGGQRVNCTGNRLDEYVTRFTFTPTVPLDHLAEVSFNYEKVPGSPFAMSVIDGSRATASGDGLKYVPANRPASFRVNASKLAEADLVIRIASPTGEEIQSFVRGNAKTGFDVQYTPTDAGRHMIQAHYANMEITGSPFYPNVFDPRAVVVEPVADGIVGQEVQFEVDHSRAGTANVTVDISGPKSRPQPKVVTMGDGRTEVTFMTVEAGKHTIKVSYGGEPVPDTPISASFTYSNLSATWNQLRLVPVRKMASFIVDPHGAPNAEILARVTDPTGNVVAGRVSKHNDRFHVEFTPRMVGSHTVEVTYGGQTVQGSPFVCNAYDSRLVQILDISQNGILGNEMGFTVDTSEAGIGDLDVQVACNGQRVTTSVTSLGERTFRFTFVPNLHFDHTADVAFNFEKVPGSPFVMNIIEGLRAVANGDGLYMASARTPATFRVNTLNLGDANLSVNITSPVGNEVPSVTRGSPQMGFDVQYVPTQPGRHTLQVLYANMEIIGSPFYPEVYDVDLVTVSDIDDGVVGEQVQFEVDSSRAGPGTITVEVIGPRKRPQPRVAASGDGRSDVTFRTMEAGEHSIKVFFNGQSVQGSPFLANFSYSNIAAKWEQLSLIPVKKPAAFEMDPRGAPNADVIVQISDPLGAEVANRITKIADRYRIDFTPGIVGEHTIVVMYGGQEIPGSPYLCNVYDTSRVHITDVSENGIIENEMGFTVDTSDAGIGDLDVQLSCNRQRVNPTFTQLDEHRSRFTFTPAEANPHLAEISYNFEKVPGSPLAMMVIDGRKVTATGEGLRLAAARTNTTFHVNTTNVGPADLSVKIYSVDGSEINPVVRGNPQSGYDVQYSPFEAGTHTIQVVYANMEISGSPFAPMVYDVSQVVVGDIRDGKVGELINFDVDCTKAGPGTVGVEIQGPKTRPQASITETANRMAEVVFKATEAGEHTIRITFNGQTVPGSPFTANFSYGNISASWENIRLIPIRQLAVFEMDPHGAPSAEIVVTVTDSSDRVIHGVVRQRGPKYSVEFTPVAVGIHMIDIEYGGQQVVGSPYMCNVYDASRVRVTDVTQNGVIGEEAGFTVDTSGAGKGDLHVQVSYDGQGVKSDYVELDQTHYRFTYTPVSALPHQADISFNFEKIPGSPVVLTVLDGSLATAHGPGLQIMPVNQRTKFSVDARHVGPAELAVRITSPKGNELESVINGSPQSGFDVQYTPQEAGRHNVQVYYANMEIRGSPFYPEAFDASLVTVSGIADGLVGEVAEFEVDASEAGPGTALVEITGPNSRIQPRINMTGQGRFAVAYVTHEGGEHSIRVLFNGMVIPGSPFFAKFTYSNISATWEHIRLIPVKRVALFEMDPHDAPNAEVTVNISDPNKNNVHGSVTKDEGKFKIEFTPAVVGPHKVEINYGGQPVTGSPCTCQVYDAGRVKVTDITQNGIIGKEMSFTVDTCEAGPGDLDVQVLCEGQRVPTSVSPMGDCRFKFTFVPANAINHMADISFNYEKIPGSPIGLFVLDGSRAIAVGEGLRSAMTKAPTHFRVETAHVGVAELSVQITSHLGDDIPAVVRGTPQTGYDVQYTPTDPGRHTIRAYYANMEISGSPFKPEVYDVSAIGAGPLDDGIVGETARFEVDATQTSGAGELTVDVKGPRKRPKSTIQSLGDNMYEVTFVPMEAGKYSVKVLYNGQVVPDSPLKANFAYGNIAVDWDKLRLIPVKEPASFTVDPEGSPPAEVKVKIVDSKGRNVPARVTNQDYAYSVEFIPTAVGEHSINLTYGGQTVYGSPYICNVYDTSKVKVTDISQNGKIGNEMGFTVDTSQAGEGDLDVQVSCEGQKVKTLCDQVDDTHYRFTFRGKIPRDHKADISFNYEKIPQSPVILTMIDGTLVTASGDGLTQIPANQMARFNVDASEVGPADLIVGIKAPSGKEVPANSKGTTFSGFDVEYTPQEVGRHTVKIVYANMEIRGSPFYPEVYDINKVKVTPIEDGIVGKPAQFEVDCSQAGPGAISIGTMGPKTRPDPKVISRGNNRYDVTFVPIEAGKHTVSVYFNSREVPGSPYEPEFFDTSGVVATWEKINLIPAGRISQFELDPRGLPEKEVTLKVIDPDGRPVKTKVIKLRDLYCLELTPLEVGPHEVTLLYDGNHIPGSVFVANVYDATKVRIFDVTPTGLVSKEVGFSVDSSLAGPGAITIEVNGPKSQPRPESDDRGGNVYDVTFIPSEGGDHTVTIDFNGVKVPDSPVKINVFDPRNIVASWENIRQIPIQRLGKFDLNVAGAPLAETAIKINDPMGKDLPANANKVQNRIDLVFQPEIVGAHQVELRYADIEVRGSPFTSNIYDASQVRIVDYSPFGKVGEECEFTVDTTGAGQGELEVRVVCNGGLIPNRHIQLDNNLYKFMFIPRQQSNHSIDIAFNLDKIPGCPLVVRVVDIYSLLGVSASSALVGLVNRPVQALIQTQGAQTNQSDFRAAITAPTGEMVPAQIVQQPDMDYKVEYSSRYTGRHTVEILYAGQAIMGSPFYVEIYDPNKIRVEGPMEGQVSEPMEFDIIRHEAGKAELALSVTSPTGRSVPFDIAPTQLGDHVSYIPQEPGPHRIFIQYGGLDVPGCPVTQTINDASTAEAYGDGLEGGVEGQMLTFFVDSKGQRGEPSVQVDGPNSVAKCDIRPEGSGRYLVSYVPMEAGVYKVKVRWNGREIAGSPFQPKVVNPNNIRVIGGWESVLTQEGYMALKLNEPKKIEFDCSSAGPGQLYAEVQSSYGPIPVDLRQLGGDRYSLTFTPPKEDDYTLTLNWNTLPVPRSPLRGSVHAANNFEKVVLTGRGLQEASVREEAEFVIDGSEAGSGTPRVHLTGVKTDIDVRIQNLGGNKYRCTYVPQQPGAYLLHIHWSDRQVKGSPFKVNVAVQSDASKVLCTGEGLKIGTMGKEIKCLIDTRMAGPGELTAHCVGPTKVAFCELHDHRDGTFTLSINPQEHGRHILQIKYGGEHVPGSPFTLKISGAPDASKVRVSGPGVEHGILATYQSRFICETRGAGAGQLTVRIRGPKGAFRVEMQRESQKDRTILCRYDPTEVGDYILSVKWSGDHVPGSPFHVQIFDTQEELERFMAENPHRRQNAPVFSERSWSEDL